jgi:hypothetical protein
MSSFFLGPDTVCERGHVIFLFSVWLSLLNIVISNYIHFPENEFWLSNLLLSLSLSLSVVCVRESERETFFIHRWLVHGHIGWFLSLDIMNSAAREMSGQASLLYADLHLFISVPKSLIQDHVVILLLILLE